MDNTVTSNLFNKLFKDFGFNHLIVIILVVFFLGGVLIYKQLTNHIPTEFKEVRAEIKEVRAEIKEVRAEIKEVKAELKGDIKEFNNKIDKNHHELKNIIIEYLGTKKN